ncbi:TetR/AcrR family transcriptional regulator [Mangrovimicrobium sediminis]|uniref:TetR/AcrR family transcriptional regulator n=2 Tax=Mangrovimicrobium sediminis TaxID=2562682 RepID=A0A4Z0LTU3_9GAMM|nr:TetR/AcrR family transcriptional regulator [Haliea sp. SAOS-164]
MSQRMLYQTEETRRHILEMAEQLFLENGFFDTQMKDVAEAVGMSRNTLYRYYRDKVDLGFAILEQILSYVIEDFRLALASSRGRPFTDHREQLTWVLQELLVRQQHESALRFIAEFDAFFSGPRIPENFRDMQNLSAWAPIISEFSAIVRAGIREGSIRDDVNPEVLLQVVLTSTKVMQQEVLLRKAAHGPDAAQLLPLMLTLLMDGLKPQD